MDTYTSKPIGWGDPRFQNLYSSIMDRGMQLENTQNIPALSNGYWNNMRGQAIEGIANSQTQAQNQLSALMAKRGMLGSGAELRGQTDIMRQGTANRADAVRNLLMQRQQSEMGNYWKAQNLRNQMAQLGLHANTAWQSARNAGAAAGMARDRFDWRKKMDIMNYMLAMRNQGAQNNVNTYNQELQGYITPQTLAAQMAYGGR